MVIGVEQEVGGQGEAHGHVCPVAGTHDSGGHSGGGEVRADQDDHARGGLHQCRQNGPQPPVALPIGDHSDDHGGENDEDRVDDDELEQPTLGIGGRDHNPVEQEEQQQRGSQSIADVDDESADEQSREARIHERGDACSGEVPAGVEAEQGRVRRWRIRQQNGRDRADDEDEAGKHRIGGAGAQPQQHDGSDTDDDADGLSRTGRGRGGSALLVELIGDERGQRRRDH